MKSYFPIIMQGSHPDDSPIFNIDCARGTAPVQPGKGQRLNDVLSGTISALGFFLFWHGEGLLFLNVEVSLNRSREDLPRGRHLGERPKLLNLIGKVTR